MSRNSRNKNPTTTTTFRASNTQLSVLWFSCKPKFASHKADITAGAISTALEMRGSRRPMRSRLPLRASLRRRLQFL
jgi:hypothetical protein